MTSLTLEVIFEGHNEFTIIYKINGKPLDVVGPISYYDMVDKDKAIIHRMLGVEEASLFDEAIDRLENS